MSYNFLKIFKKDYEDILDDFIEKNTSCINTYDINERDSVRTFYKNIFECLGKDKLLEDRLYNSFEGLTKYKISLDVPYILMINEINALKNTIINEMDEKEIGTNIIAILSLFKNINNKVANIYLSEYINKLEMLNNIRISSLSDLVEKNIIIHYESHLLWLTKLAIHIKNEDKHSFPELDENLCDFGKWLKEDGKNIIQNNSKYKTLDTLHKNLHLFARKIYSHMGDNEHHIKITYLEKCELISLSIGTELALIDNVIMNTKVTKDTLTGALNRNALRGIFENQYELALATGNPFIIGICDLDHFKKINDTYGHIAGDRVLESFVKIAKKHIRSSDVIIRYGGEEFIIILPALNQKKGFEVLNNVCKLFRESVIEIGNLELKATLSIGMMEIKPQKPFRNSLIDEYIMIADQQLYKAKRNGRDRVESY